MSIVHLLLGGNSGDRGYFLNTAIEKIADQLGRVIRKSSVYESEPWGFDSPMPFLNQVLRIETKLSPLETLSRIKEIETNLGRKRQSAGGYKSRQIDIDILLFNDLVFSETDLQIPHPRMHLRKFTLLPLSEISGTVMHPVLQVDMNTLYETCSDNLKVELFKGA